jgi:hemerythrin-like domain-containing protein
MSAARLQPLQEARAKLVFEPAPCVAEDFRAPIDFIAADHARQLAACNVMERLLRNPRHGVERIEVEAIWTYLVHQFPLHIADEEDDLFPLLRGRCPSSDNIDEIFELLCREHETDTRLNRDVTKDLEDLIAGRAFGDPAQFLMNLFAFSQTQRRHLAWENAVILPRARAYLRAIDHGELGRRMAARRGIDYGGWACPRSA